MKSTSGTVAMYEQVNRLMSSKIWLSHDQDIVITYSTTQKAREGILMINIYWGQSGHRHRRPWTPSREDRSERM